MHRTTSNEIAVSYAPTAEQWERARRLRRFNRLTVLGPVILGSVIILALVILLIWLAFGPAGEEWRVFLSALADIVVMLSLCPLTLLCATVPLAATGWTIYRRQNPSPPRPADAGRLQLLLWRVDAFMSRRLEPAVRRASNRAADALISLHARAARIEAFVNSLLDRS